jgi:hypothetical protein
LRTGKILKNNPVTEQALRRIQSGAETCVVIQIDPAVETEPQDLSCAVGGTAGEIIYAANGRGVAPLLALYRDAPEKMRGNFVLDKIVGKAAAVILVLGGARKVYGEVMSIAARDYLAARNIPFEYGTLVDNITNRSGDGLCPIERSVLDADDPAECLERILKTVQTLAAGVQ